MSWIAVGVPLLALGSAACSVAVALGFNLYRRRHYKKVISARRQLRGDLETLQQQLELVRPQHINSQDNRIALPALLGEASELESSGHLLDAVKKYETMLERSEKTPGDPVVTEAASFAASKIEKLSTGLDRSDAERALERATATLSQLRLVCSN